MVLLIITIFFICSLICFILNLIEDENGFTGLFLGILTVFFAVGVYKIYNGVTTENNIKIDLPEEIYQARQNDTLYINKRTKDSIYLGFKPIKIN